MPNVVVRLLVDTWLVAQRSRSRGITRLAPGRFEYSFIEFVLFVMVLLGGTFVVLKLVRDYRQRRDERLTETSGGWRIRSQLDVEAGPPYNRFPGLALRMPHDVMEGHDEGFEVAYFTACLPRFVGDAWKRNVPHAIVQLPVDPPQRRHVASDGPAEPIDGWGLRASQVLRDVRGVVIETAPLALMVSSSGASAAEVGRVALALAKAVVADAGSASRQGT
ncbi:MAG: hypothetical protein AB7U83_07405 [Vicinamibacterales bacterium]